MSFRCHECKGGGTLLNPDGRTSRPCWLCKGSGTVANYEESLPLAESVRYSRQRARLDENDST
jgi:DnaJ-class molecular chaperone